jgi:hypothetical protein
MALRALELRPSTTASTDKVVLYVLADHHNEKTNACNPSLVTIARCAGLSRSTVPVVKERLRATGLIDFAGDARKGGRGRSMQIELRFVELWAELGKPRIFRPDGTVVQADRFPALKQSLQRTVSQTRIGRPEKLPQPNRVLEAVRSGSRNSRPRRPESGESNNPRRESKSARPSRSLQTNRQPTFEEMVQACLEARIPPSNWESMIDFIYLKFGFTLSDKQLRVLERQLIDRSGA